MTEAQIKHMVDRFLGWKLPKSFNPDGGISFKKTFNDHLPTPMKHEPIGTNLLDAIQAEAMVRHMVEGLPKAAVEIERLLSAMTAYADRVEKIAFSIAPPNPHTPELVMLAIGMRAALAETMRNAAP